MKSGSLRSYALATTALFGCVSTARAQVVLFSDNFDVDHTSNWTVNRSNAAAGGDRSNFLFDYSQMGIPSAPNSVGGTTIGLQLQANFSAGVLSGVSASPTGQSFGGDYELRFDVWMNFNGPAPAGATGSTQVTGGAIGTAGTTAQTVGARDSLVFVTTGDGQSAQDYRVYPNAALAAPTGTPVTYAAGTTTTPDVRNQADVYYAGFGGATIPGAQTTQEAAQNGTTATGALGFEWHDVSISKVGNTVTWKIDDLTIATVNTTTITTGGSNIGLVQADTAASSPVAAGQPFIFGLFDNVRVTQVPEPSTYALLGMGALALAVRARRGFRK